jgi:undecaprenyl diphosphate synthase
MSISGTASLPRHVAIIMDGNGRWAQKQGKPRLKGHQAGAETLRSIIEESIAIGVQYLTVYAFSTENWKRPAEEVSGLMSLLKFYLEKELRTLEKEGIKIQFIGNRETLSADLIDIIHTAEQRTHTNTRFTFVVAFNYGSRDEILRAVRHIATLSKDNKLEPQDISEDTLSEYLDTKDIPDPELLIRTSGEYRLSNFLLWQCSYAELFFTETLWPDFSKEEYRSIVTHFSQRERRCGKVSEQLKKS